MDKNIENKIKQNGTVKPKLPSKRKLLQISDANQPALVALREKLPSQLPKHISQRDVKKLFSAVENEKHALILKLCYGMGLRVSEIVNLKITDIDRGNMQGHQLYSEATWT